MRALLSVLAFSLLAGIAAAEDICRNPRLTLANETLFLASVENGGDVVLNEYLRRDETFDNWKVLFAVRYVRSAKSVDEAVARWKAYVAQVQSPGRSLHEEDGSTPSDRRFALSIRPMGDRFLENDQLRFVPGPNGQGVVYYQAAVRVNPRDESDLMQGLLKQVALAEALNTLTLQAFPAMPPPAAPPSSAAVKP